MLVYIVTETLRCALRDEPERIPQAAAEVLPALRQALGGERHYIPATPAALDAEDWRRQQIVADALTGASTPEIERRHGVSRSTIYRLVKRFAKDSAG